MIRGPYPSRRGIALLLVLATLIVVTLTLAAIAMRAASVQLERGLDRADRMANQLARSAEPLIFKWLTEQSHAIVLPPDVSSPEVHLLHHRWTAHDVTCELRITAWDQSGMIPLEAVRSGSALRLTLPEHILRQIERTELDPSVAPGLDLFDHPEQFETTPFPMPAGGDLVIFASNNNRPRADSENHSIPRAERQRQPLGAFIATHQSETASGQTKPGPWINIHTAPMELVDRALREAGRGGRELIVAAREEGRMLSIGELSSRDRSASDRSTPQLISSSRTWAFRIDVRVNRIRKSWWATYQITDSETEASAKSGSSRRQTMRSRRHSSNSSPGSSGSSGSSVNSGNSGGWECVQRVRIYE